MHACTFIHLNSCDWNTPLCCISLALGPFVFQTVNKVLIAYSNIVRRDFEKYTGSQKTVSTFDYGHFQIIIIIITMMPLRIIKKKLKVFI